MGYNLNKSRYMVLAINSSYEYCGFSQVWRLEGNKMKFKLKQSNPKLVYEGYR